MSKHKVAVISDTHNMLRPKVLEVIENCEQTIHAGDVTKAGTLENLKDLTDLTIVRGNCDRELEDLPNEELKEIFGKKIYVTHNKKHVSPLADKADIIIYGHSHIYDESHEDDKIYLNPGSAGPRRFGRPASMAVMEIDTEDGSVEIEKIDLNED